MNEARANDAEVLGARGGSRTPKGFRPLDPKSSASASFATLASQDYRMLTVLSYSTTGANVPENAPVGGAASFRAAL